MLSYSELEFFKFYKGFDLRYLPHRIYLPMVAHKLNDYKYTKLLEHKSLLGYLAKGNIKFPYCFVRCVNQEYYDNNMRQISRQEAVDICSRQISLVVKDSVDSAGGNGVEIVRLEELGDAERIDVVNRQLNLRKRDFVIQECIKQHSSFARFCPSSINTLRVTTLYLNGRYSTLSIVLRHGREQAKVDNWGAGGVIVGVHEDGRLYERGYDIKMNEYNNIEGTSYDSIVLDQVPDMLNKIEEAHKSQFSLCKLIGWDVCFNESNEPVVIELNASQPGVIGEQLCTGPIFGDRTQEVVDYCKDKEFKYRKSLFEF